MKLYVGNLNYNVTQAQLQAMFSEVGEVSSVFLVTNRHTSKSSGFGFVTMTSKEAGQAAALRFHGHVLLDRRMTVHEVVPTDDPGRKASSTVVYRKSPPPPVEVVEGAEEEAKVEG